MVSMRNKENYHQILPLIYSSDNYLKTSMSGGMCISISLISSFVNSFNEVSLFVVVDAKFSF